MLAITALLVRGTKESAQVNLVMVVVKLAALVFFIVVALPTFSTQNFSPFAPDGTDAIVSGAAIIFFAYIGFDAVSTGSEEAQQPGPGPADRDHRIAGDLHGLLHSHRRRRDRHRDTSAARRAATRRWQPRWRRAPESRGRPRCCPSVRVVAITSVVLVILYGQTRIFFAMCRDGLMPEGLATVNPRYGTPARLTIGLGVLIAILAAFVPLSRDRQAGEHRHAVRLRPGQRRRDHPAPHPAGHAASVPGAVRPWFPLLGIAFAIYLMIDLPLGTWVRFVGWLRARRADLRGLRIPQLPASHAAWRVRHPSRRTGRPHPPARTA